MSRMTDTIVPDTPRTDPPHNPPPGHEWAAVPEGPYWRIDAGRRCRAHASKGRRACGAPSVAAINRPRTYFRSMQRRDCWWAYCAEHLYGQWIEGGQVMRWVLRETAGRAEA